MIKKRASTGFSVMFLIVLLGSCGKHPELAENHYRAGRDFIVRGETDSALVELRLAIQADAKHIQANLSYQNLMRYDLGKRDEVIAEYEAKLRKHPNDPVYRYFSANLENNPERKLAMVQEAVALDPTFYEGHVLLGEAYQQVGYDDDALAAFERAMVLDPSRIQAYTRIAYMHMDNQEPEKAAGLLRKALEMDTTQFQTYSTLWRAEYDAAQDKQAAREKILKEFDQVLARHPDHRDLLGSMPSVLRHIGEEQRAEDIEELILEKDPAGVYAQNLDYAQIWRKTTLLERREAAETWLAKYPKGSMRTSVVQMNLMFAVDDPAISDGEMETIISRVLAESAEKAWVHNTIAWGYYLNKPGQYEKALDHAAQAVSLADNNIVHYYLDTQGWAYYKLERYNEAVKCLLKADSLYQKLGAADDEVTYHLGAAYLKTGNLQKGLDYLCRSLALSEREEVRALFREAYSAVYGTEKGADEYLIRQALAVSAVKEPYSAPDFQLVSLKGEQVVFSSHAGKIAVVNFWQPG